MATGGEKSVDGGVSRQLRSGTSRITDRVVHFSLCSSGDEGVDDSILPRSSAPRVGQEIAVVTDPEGQAVDPFVASKFGIMLL